MNFQTKFKILLLKSYFDAGFAWSKYLTYFIGFFALASMDVKTTMIVTLAYGICCFFFGWFLYKYGWIEAQVEVSNQYNRFVHEVRKKLIKNS